MPLNLASPGILVREVDLTAGRVDPTSDAVGAIVGPFAKGPVNEPVLERMNRTFWTILVIRMLLTSIMKIG